MQWNRGKHSFTFGGEIAWLQYNYLVNDTGVNPLQLTFSNSLTAGYVANTTTQNNATGQGYASFLLGAANGATFTQSSVPETGGRFRPISPYVQDNWKVTSRLTLDLGLRWDYYPSYREVKDRFSYFDPNKSNTLVGIKGALAFGGNGDNTCNCRTPANDYYKNFGPRVGFAFQADPKTVFRGSYGIIYTHGNNNGGSAQSRQGSGLQGFSTSPNTTTTNPGPGQTGSGFYSIDSPYPSYQLPPTLDPNLGTYYTTASSQANQTVTYADPYYGGRAPQFINWSFGLQREINASTVLTMSYVGSQGHFLTPDSLNGRGVASKQARSQVPRARHNPRQYRHRLQSGSDRRKPSLSNLWRRRQACDLTGSQTLPAVFGSQRCLRLRGQYPLPCAADVPQPAALPWPHVHGQLHLGAGHRQ